MILADLPTPVLIAELSRRRDEISRALVDSSPLAESAVQAVCSAWCIDRQTLLHLSRPRVVTNPRQAAMVILRDAGLSFQAIADFFKLHHSTVIHAVATHQKRLSNAAFAARFAASEQIFSNSQYGI